jgi:hypothetical protein
MPCQKDLLVVEDGPWKLVVSWERRSATYRKYLGETLLSKKLHRLANFVREYIEPLNAKGIY